MSQEKDQLELYQDAVDKCDKHLKHLQASANNFRKMREESLRKLRAERAMMQEMHDSIENDSELKSGQKHTITSELNEVTTQYDPILESIQDRIALLDEQMVAHDLFIEKETKAVEMVRGDLTILGKDISNVTKQKAFLSAVMEIEEHVHKATKDMQTTVGEFEQDLNKIQKVAKAFGRFCKKIAKEVSMSAKINILVVKSGGGLSTLLKNQENKLQFLEGRLKENVDSTMQHTSTIKNRLQGTSVTPQTPGDTKR